MGSASSRDTAGMRQWAESTEKKPWLGYSLCPPIFVDEQGRQRKLVLIYSAIGSFFMGNGNSQILWLRSAALSRRA